MNMEPPFSSSSDPATRSDPSGGPSPGPIGRRRFLQASAPPRLATASSTGLDVGATCRSTLPAPASSCRSPVSACSTPARTDSRTQRFDAQHRARADSPGSFGVPADATAIVATVTAVNLAGPNWVTVVPPACPSVDLLAQNRLVSALNMTESGQATANLPQVKLGTAVRSTSSRRRCAR